MNDRSLFRPTQRNKGELFRRREDYVSPRVKASINRLNNATQSLKQGWYGSVQLSSYQQQEGTTCFFSGPIALARDFNGAHIPETPLAQRARALGLLSPHGAATTEDDDRKRLERFVHAETGISVKFHEPTYGDQQEDLELLRIIVERGNLASLLYPLTDYVHDWETFFGVSKHQGEEEVHWHSNFSPRGKLNERTTPQMAELLYASNYVRPYLLICELQVQTPL